MTQLSEVSFLTNFAFYIYLFCNAMVVLSKQEFSEVTILDKFTKRIMAYERMKKVQKMN